LSDEFDQADSLQAWQDHAAVEGWPNWIEQVDVNTTSAGHLYLVPATSGWFRDDRGVFLFKTVTGDFDVTTRILATGKAQELPSRTYSLSGLMVRAPRDVTADTWTPGGENWLFITTGYGDERPGNLAGKPQIETKTTRNSESDLTLRVVPPGWIDLRVVRVGANFLMLYRSEGKPWQISRRFIRPDLPATLQVGLNAYSADMSVRGPQDMRDTTPTSGDLVVRSEYVRFQRPHMEADLRARAAEGELTNAEWKTWVESLPDAAPAHE
jgi:regulation of enolase protein 1 (concanavalin A-like superfamily)